MTNIDDITINTVHGLEQYVEMLLRCRPWGCIEKDGAHYQRITSFPNYQAVCVVENQDWAIGFDNQPLNKLPDNLVRIWYRKDWETCDNHNRSVRATIETKQAEYKAVVKGRRDAIRQHLMSAPGMIAPIVEQLVNSLSDDDAEKMYNTIRGVAVMPATLAKG